MHDRQPTPGQEGRVKITRENGESFFARIEMADTPLHEGTPLIKQTLLQDATASMFGLSDEAVPDDVYAFLGKYNQHWWKRANSGDTEFVQSSNRNAYPDSGVSGNYEYTYLGIPFDNLVTAPKIEIGSYVGTGTYGSAAPSTLTFDFEPKLLIITPNSNASEYLFIAPYGRTYINTQLDNVNYGSVIMTWSGTTVSWYCSTHATYDPADGQMNHNNATYHYIAIG